MTTTDPRTMSPEALRRRKRAYSTIVVLMTMLAFATVGVSLMSFSGNQALAAHSTTGKIQANILAESGIHVLYDRIRKQMLEGQTYPRQIEEAQVEARVEGDEAPVGSYRARVIDVKSVQTDVTVNSVRKVRRTFYTFLIEGDGRSRSGSMTRYRAKFDATIDHSYIRRGPSSLPAGGTPDMIRFPVGALVSNSTVTYRGEGGLRTLSPNGDDAHILANGGLTWETRTGDKSTVMTPDVVELDGQILVPNGPPFERTVGPLGLGNLNGSRNFKSPALPPSGSFPGSAPDEVQRLVDAAVFASRTDVANWKSAWFTVVTSPLAMAGFSDADTNANGVFDSGDISPRMADGKRVILTPARIRGNFRIEPGQSVSVLPRETNQRQNVLYVEGDIENRGEIRNLGVHIVALGRYRDTPTAKYSVDWSEGLFVTRSKALRRSSLLAMAPDAGAVTIRSREPSLLGLVYAPLGGIRVLGDSPDLAGVLVAGGAGTRGGILVEPNDDGLATFRFEPSAAFDDSTTPGGGPGESTTWALEGVARPFVAGKLYDWVEIPLDSNGAPLRPTATNVGLPKVGPAPMPAAP
jgi:hypothetical protein